MHQVMNQKIDPRLGSHEGRVILGIGLRQVVMQVTVANVAEGDDANARVGLAQRSIGSVQELGNARYRHRDVVLDADALDLLGFGNGLA